MAKQQGFDFISPAPMPAHCPVTIQPRDPHVDARDVPRLKGQNLAILTLLQSKPEVSNTELAAISLKYTSRTDDIRKHGYDIRSRRGADGVWWYALAEGSAS